MYTYTHVCLFNLSGCYATGVCKRMVHIVESHKVAYINVAGVDVVRSINSRLLLQQHTREIVCMDNTQTSYTNTII